MTAPAVIVSAAALGLGVGAVGVGMSLVEPEATVVLAEGQYLGVCATVTPPTPDPCDAVNGALRFGALGDIVNVPYLSKWQAANPGEVQRLAAIMSSPLCSTPPTPQPQVMRTFFGAHLAAIMEAIACARHPEPISWPVPNPALDPNRADKQPPSAPGPITVTPSG